VPQYRARCTSCSFSYELQQDNLPTDDKCPSCKTAAVKWRKLPKIKRRANLNANQSLAFKKDPRTTAGKRSSTALDDEFDFDDDDSDDDDDNNNNNNTGKRAKADDDDEYSTLVNGFNPSIRLTAQGKSARAPLPGHPTVTTPWTQVAANPAGRGNTATVMGAALNGGTPLSATDHAQAQLNQGPLPVAYDWCHVIGDCLGGPTIASNLYAGGVHANTAMMYIEMAIKGRTFLEVQVEIGTPSPNVAEWFKYRVRKRNSTIAPLEIVIDSRSAGFSRQDRDDQNRDVKAFVARCTPT
jgi:hypothetical protein